MGSKDLQHQLSLLMIRASMKAKYDLMETAEQHDITTMQALTLCLIDKGQPIQMKTISEFMSCDPSNITSNVEQLVNKKLVERKEASYDRRVKTLTLTNKGEELRDELLELSLRTRLPNLCELSDTEVDQMISVLEKASGMCASSSISNLAEAV